MPDFEVFRKDLAALRLIPMATVQKRGTISLNRSAFVALGEPEAVELMYDATSKIVGLRGVSHRAANSCLIRSSTGRESGPYVVTAIAFLKFYGLSMESSFRWPAFMTEDVLCVDLTQPGTPVTSNRAAK